MDSFPEDFRCGVCDECDCFGGTSLCQVVLDKQEIAALKARVSILSDLIRLAAEVRAGDGDHREKKLVEEDYRLLPWNTTHGPVAMNREQLLMLSSEERVRLAKDLCENTPKQVTFRPGHGGF